MAYLTSALTSRPDGAKRPRPDRRLGLRCGEAPSPSAEQARSMRRCRGESSRSGTAPPAMRTPSRDRHGQPRCHSPAPKRRDEAPTPARSRRTATSTSAPPGKKATAGAIQHREHAVPRATHSRSIRRRRSSASHRSNRRMKRATSGSSWSATNSSTSATRNGGVGAAARSRSPRAESHALAAPRR
jgi:hypothetical protein